jgi:hypothetical protein
LELAFQFADMARKIYMSYPTHNELKLADVLTILGEISRESGSQMLGPSCACMHLVFDQKTLMVPWTTSNLVRSFKSPIYPFMIAE